MKSDYNQDVSFSLKRKKKEEAKIDLNTMNMIENIKIESERFGVGWYDGWKRMYTWWSGGYLKRV